jgi:hypothetical protein
MMKVTTDGKDGTVAMSTTQVNCHEPLKLNIEKRNPHGIQAAAHEWRGIGMGEAVIACLLTGMSN